MRKLLALLAIISILISMQGCADLIAYLDAKYPEQPTGHLYVSGWGGSGDPFAVVYGPGMNAFGASSGVTLYREPEGQKPIVEMVEVSEGKRERVEVWPHKCLGSMEPVTISVDAGGTKIHSVYLCGKSMHRTHEICHAKGFQHTAWVNTGVARCATVTAAGYKCGYKVGEEICVANDHEFVNARK